MRRQNQSCDQCRRTKRRCIRLSSDDNLLQPQRCTTCARLQYECTFEFANLQFAKKQHPSNFISPRHHRWKQPATTETFRAQFKNGHIADGRGKDLPNQLDGRRRASVESLDDSDERWLDSSAYCSNIDVQLSPSSGNHRAKSTEPDPRQKSAKGPTLNTSKRNQCPSPTQISLSLYSPIQPLNTSAAGLTFNHILKNLYHKVQDGASSRFLSHGCNSVSVITLQGLRDTYPTQSLDANLALAANATKYGQDTEMNSHVSSHLVVDSASGEELFLPSYMTFNSQKQEVTMVSLVRFLDRLGEIYHAKSRKGSAQESLALLNTVIRAFSMQWLLIPRSSEQHSRLKPFHHNYDGIESSSATETTAYTDAWLYARRCIQEAKSRQTFSFIYAAFVFDMTVKPDQLPKELAQTCDSHEFLDEALDHLAVLHKAARQLCTILGDDSNYAKIILSGLDVMERFGFIRDTVSAFINERSCRVASWNDLDHHLESLEESIAHAIGKPQINIFLINVPDVCQSISFRIFQTWQEILRLKAHVNRKQTTNANGKAKLSNYVNAAVTAMDDFNTKFRPFLDACQDNFKLLQHQAQVASALAIIYSDFGLIVLAEQIDNCNRSESFSQYPQSQEKSDKYRFLSTSSTARLLRSIMHLSLLETASTASPEQDRTPLVFEHINLKLVICAIYKCIENLVHMYRIAITYSQFVKELNDQDLNQRVHLGRNIKTSFECLISLNHTIIGSFAARTALENLLRRYGETVLECWLLSDEDVR